MPFCIWQKLLALVLSWRPSKRSFRLHMVIAVIRLCAFTATSVTGSEFQFSGIRRSKLGSCFF